jgi:nicotinate-nucleotide pyrophosphorylase (carboxylating)
MHDELILNDVSRALAEDVGTGDLTAALIPVDAHARATVISREKAVLCGTAWFDASFHALDSEIRIVWHHHDGDPITAGATICDLSGPARALLTGERVALNFLQTLSGVATETHKYVDAIRGTRATILDTRKTIPGLRHALKYAVVIGGGENHRMGLYDAILIKENHITAAGSIAAALGAAQHLHGKASFVEIETENLDQLREALAAGAERILLDDFDLDSIRAAVMETAGRAKIEVSGGITLDNVRAIAETGVDYISVGALTKNIRAVDLSMRFG